MQIDRTMPRALSAFGGLFLFRTFSPFPQLEVTVFTSGKANSFTKVRLLIFFAEPGQREDSLQKYIWDPTPKQ